MTTGPNIPAPKPVTLEAKKTALLVLDQNEQARDPKLFPSAHKLIPALTKLLAKARGKGVYVIFTYSLNLKGTPDGKIYSGYNRKESEPVLTPDAFDKFQDSELQSLLDAKKVDTVVITGSRSNICVLHTATTAARFYKYNVVIPTDGVEAESRYDYEYSLHHLATFPGGVSKKVTFTTVDGIAFK